MAGAYPTLGDSEEKTNFSKLSRLLIDGGTQALRCVFDSKHPPPTLAISLNALHLSTLTALMSPKKGKKPVLNKDQWNALYPPAGSPAPKSEDFDITLLFVLLRNICNLSAPASTGWDNKPSSTDISLEANLARIKWFRNKVYGHITSTAIDNVSFEQYWKEISCALVSLGADQVEIDELKSGPLGMKDYINLLEEWWKSDVELAKQVKELEGKIGSLNSKVDVQFSEIKKAVEMLSPDHSSIMDDSYTTELREIKTNLEKLTSEQKDLYKLAKCDFTSHIESLVKAYDSNTRHWILDDIFSFAEGHQSSSRLVLITAESGIGKSTIAAVVCDKLKGKGCLGASHFFEYNNSTRSGPRLMLQSLACQMCDSIPGFRDVLEKRLDANLGKRIPDMNCEELFTLLFEEPFSRLCQRNRTKNYVIVVDALDECFKSHREEFIKALLKKLPVLPTWLHFIITTRPSRSFSDLSQIAKVITIDAEDNHSFQDIYQYFSALLTDLFPDANTRDIETTTQKLAKTSKGSFLFAHFAVQHAREQNIDLIDIGEVFPRGLSSVYETYFSRLRNDLHSLGFNEDECFNMLAAVATSRDPIPKDLFFSTLGLGSDVSRRERKAKREVWKAIELLFNVEREQVAVCHKSVIDWLTLAGDDEHDFSVLESDGEKVLQDQCCQILNDLKSRIDYNASLKLNDNERYALRFELTRGTERILEFQFLAVVIVLVVHYDKDWKFLFSSLLRNNEGCAIIEHCLKYILEGDRIYTCLQVKRLPFSRYMELIISKFFVSNLGHDLSKEAHSYLQDKSLPHGSVEQRLFYEFDDSTLISVSASRIVVASHDICLVYNREWDVIFELELPIFASLCISPDDQFLVYLNRQGFVEIRHFSSLNQAEVVKNLPPAKSCFVFGSHVWKIIVLLRDGSIFVLDGLKVQVETSIGECNPDVDVVAVSPDGHILINDKTSREFYLFHYQNGDTKIDVDFRFNASRDSKYTTSTFSVAFSPDGTILALVDKWRIIRLFDTSTGAFRKILHVGYGLGPGTSYVFASNTHMVLLNEPAAVINLETDKVEHIFGVRKSETLIRYSSVPRLHFLNKRGSNEHIFVLREDHALEEYTLHNMNKFFGSEVPQCSVVAQVKPLKTMPQFRSPPRCKMISPGVRRFLSFEPQS